MQSLKIDRQNTILNNIVLTETVDLNLLDKLINSKFLKNEEWLNWNNEKQQLEAYRKKFKNGKASITYKQSKVGYGRVSPVRALGLCSLRRAIRHTIAKGWVDIDIKNCHPVILEQICKKNNIKCEFLSRYVNNRDEALLQVMNSYNVSKEDAKNLFIRLLYLGSFKNWLEEHNLEFIPDVDLTDFENEIKIIATEIAYNNPELEKAILKAKEEEIKNVKASCLSYYLQDYERRMLECVYSYLVEIGIIKNQNAVLCYDGIMVQEEDFNILIVEQLNQQIYNKLDFKVEFVVKSMDEAINNIVENDEPTKLYNEYKEEFEKSFFKLNNPLKYCKVYNNSIQFFDKSGLQEYLIDKYEDSDFNFYELWRKDPKKLCYDNIVFNPAKHGNNGKEYNLFKGYKLDSDTLYKFKDDYEETSDFFKLLKYVSGGDCEYNYLKNWIAHIVQKPYKKTNVAVVLYSEVGGIGKNAIIDCLLKLFGEYSGKIENIEELTSKFNVHLCNKLFIYGDEINANAKKIANQLKNIITRTEQNMERKGVDPILINDYSNYIFTTNNEVCFKLDDQDRRFFMVKCPNVPLKSEVYKNFYSYINDESNMKELFNYFKNIDISDSGIGTDRTPMTKYKAQIIYETKPAYIQMFYKDTELFSNRTVQSTELYKMSLEYAKKNYLTCNYSITAFGKDIGDLIGNYKKKSHGIIKFIIPSTVELRKHLYNINKDYYRNINDLDNDEEPNFDNIDDPEVTPISTSNSNFINY
jgi:hypothetical protein